MDFTVRKLLGLIMTAFEDKQIEPGEPRKR
jgi:hypothetical protein